MVIRAITFDVYSALFDTLSGLTGALAHLLRRRGAPGDPQTLARSWRAKHMEYLLLATALGEASTNRQAIERSAAHTLRGVIGAPLGADEFAQLTSAWEALPPWPEAVGVLQTVRSRSVVLGALSNGDEDMLHALLRLLPVPFDHVISTGGGPFKPHRAVYEKALRTLGVPSEEILHVAGSPTDAMGATAAGIRTLWVNRAADAVVEPTLRPAYEGPTLRSVLEILTDLG